MAPQVAITNPADRSRVPWQAQGSYSVAVSYDGRSTRYGDIPSNHVLVAATYLPDVDKVPALKDAEVPPAGLIAMTQSNCMGCHDFTTTAVGPSFAAIGKHYPDASSIGTLADHIRTGSAGTWGTTRMPPHPDLDSAQASAMARWIVEHANDPAVRYHVGADGMFRMEAPAVPGPRAGIMLTAAYTGPLKPGDSRHTEGGRNTVILEGIGR
jgi:cytochrome c